MGLKYNEIYKPYITNQAPSVENQVVWLLHEGIPKHVIAKALDKVYKEIEEGRIFEEEYKTGTLINTPTQVLWKYLRSTARKMYVESITLDEEIVILTKWQKILKVLIGEL
jgi:hypothetical protein